MLLWQWSLSLLSVLSFLITTWTLLCPFRENQVPEFTVAALYRHLNTLCSQQMLKLPPARSMPPPVIQALEDGLAL